MLTRLARDGGVLIAFCLAFYLVSMAVNWIGTGGAGDGVTEYSDHRELADQYLSEKNWAKAAEHYEELTKSDEYNGHAWYRLGECWFQCRGPFVRSIYREETKTEPDQAKVQDLKQQAEPFGQKAIVAYERAIDFPRYRNMARFQIARVHAFAGRNDVALDYLSRAMDDGFYCDRTFRWGIRSAYEFRDLRETEEFVALAKQEQLNRNRSFRRKQNQNKESEEPGDSKKLESTR